MEGAWHALRVEYIVVLDGGDAYACRGGPPPRGTGSLRGADEEEQRMTGTTRSRLLDELSTVSRRSMASYALFNQAVADHLGLHPTDLQCLNLLTLEGGPVTTGRIAELTGLTTGSATRLVDRLEKAGYVVRERDASDRRRVLVATVPEKAAEFGRVWGRLSDGWSALFDDLDDSQLGLVIDHMRRTTEFSAAQVARLRAGDV
jgi:DNA-binding MarR family transcriptional regulator